MLNDQMANLQETMVFLSEAMPSILSMFPSEGEMSWWWRALHRGPPWIHGTASRPWFIGVFLGGNCQFQVGKSSICRRFSWANHGFFHTSVDFYPDVFFRNPQC